METEDPGPVHVHGLRINPADGALFVTTHAGLFRAPDGERIARRVGGRYQDTMGFMVVGPNRFLGSGHPDGREDLPPFLGLIRSNDAAARGGRCHCSASATFTCFEASGKSVYGYGSDFEVREQGLLASVDGGRSWDERSAPSHSSRW